jgi:hypothetical protein
MDPDPMIGEDGPRDRILDSRHVAVEAVAARIDRTGRPSPVRRSPRGGRRRPGRRMTVQAMVLIGCRRGLGVPVRIVAGDATEGRGAGGVATAQDEPGGLESDEAGVGGSDRRGRPVASLPEISFDSGRFGRSSSHTINDGAARWSSRTSRVPSHGELSPCKHPVTPPREQS